MYTGSTYMPVRGVHTRVVLGMYAEGGSRTAVPLPVRLRARLLHAPQHRRHVLRRRSAEERTKPRRERRRCGGGLWGRGLAGSAATRNEGKVVAQILPLLGYIDTMCTFEGRRIALYTSKFTCVHCL